MADIGIETPEEREVFERMRGINVGTIGKVDDGMTAIARGIRSKLAIDMGAIDSEPATAMLMVTRKIVDRVVAEENKVVMQALKEANPALYREIEMLLHSGLGIPRHISARLSINQYSGQRDFLLDGKVICSVRRPGFARCNDIGWRYRDEIT